MNYLLIICFSLMLMGCQTSTEKEKDTKTTKVEIEDVSNSTEKINLEFWNRFEELKGKSFEGEIIEAPEGDDFRGKKLVMHVLDVKNDTIYIPFNVGENLSRTWILTKSGEGIQLKHDHRKEDGSNDEVTMYGGQTPNSGLEGMAMFPADQETVDMLPKTATNLWWITVDDQQFTYNLRRIGSAVKFSIGFDLESPIETPEPSWGWEDYEVE